MHRRARITAAALSLVICVSFVVVGHHHHGLIRSGEEPAAGVTAGTAGSGLLCHACVLAGTPAIPAADAAQVRPPAESTAGTSPPGSKLPGFDPTVGFDPRGPPVFV